MFFQGELDPSTGAELLFTVEDPDDPTNEEIAYIVKEGEIVNTGEGDAYVTLWLVPEGETVADEWIWRPSSLVEGGGASLVYSGSKTLQWAYECWAEVDVSGVNALIGGASVDERSS
jgi:hypothetical protein